jgi:hypothetical protein
MDGPLPDHTERAGTRRLNAVAFILKVLIAHV